MTTWRARQVRGPGASNTRAPARTRKDPQMPRRSVLLIAAIVAATATTSSDAAPKPQLTDPKGDAVGGQAGTDIVSVTYATTGTGSGRAYVPKKFTVTMVLAGDVITQPGLTYEIDALTDNCGEVTFSAQNGSPYSQITGVNGWADWGSCTKPGTDGPSALELIPVAVKGNTLVWSFPMKSLPENLERGTLFSDFEARVDPTNPVLPLQSSTTGSALGLIDKGVSKAAWKLG